MRSLRGSLVVLVFALASGLLAQDVEVVPGLHATGEFLVSVRGDVSALPQRSTDGWTKKTLATVHVPEGGVQPQSDALHPRAQGSAVKTWVLVAPPPTTQRDVAMREHPWDAAHRHVADKSAGRLSAVLADFDTDQVIEVEPVVAYEIRGVKERLEKATARTESTTVCSDTTPPSGIIVCGAASFQWPNVPRVSWHQDDDRSELRKAQRRAAPFFQSGTPVLVAHLDTGYYQTRDMITPPNFSVAMSTSMIPNDPCGPTGIDCYHGGTPNGHGPSTLSVLAGGKVAFAGGNGYPPYDDYMGGAPLAQVFTYRVSPSVILLYPMYVANGIMNAVANNADVISMSMGGAPSYYLRDAVNEAYDNGTSMFFAAADFLRLPIPIIPIEIPPHTMVYPARFTTATPVSGITASGRSYGLNPSWFLSVFRGEAFNWMLRGSYGPARLMKDRALTAFSPNITARYGTASYPPNRVRFGFEGTSAATPQAAAAAALWLQVHRNDFTNEQWRSWVKTQSAYDALTSSADLPKSKNAIERFGAGVLKANRALDVPKPANPVKRPPGTIGVDWITILAAILGIDPNDPPPSGKEFESHKSMLQLEVAQLLTTEPELREIVHGDFESQPTPAQLRRLSLAIERNPRASSYLRRAVAAGPARRGRI